MNLRDIEIIGLGPVGITTGDIFLKKGFRVNFRDNDEVKIKSLIEQRWNEWEPELANVFISSPQDRYSFKTMEESSDSDVYVICVGTPIDNENNLSLIQIEDVLSHIIERVPKSILIRSTLPISGFRYLKNKFSSKLKKCNLIYMPEFLRTGVAVEDAHGPEVNVIAYEGNEVDVINIVSNFPQAKHSFLVSPEEAEILKYTNNIYHALKVCFANEVARISESVGANGNKVMSMFVADKKLNISDKYFSPGAPYGGPCLNKEINSVIKFAELNGVDIPLMRAIKDSNEISKRCELKTLELICNNKNVLVLGDGFKRGSKDSRNSVLKDQLKLLKAKKIEVSETVIALEGFDIVIWGSLELSPDQIASIKIPIYDYFSGRLM